MQRRPVVPGMSSVIVATGFGGPEVLSVVDEPIAPPGYGEVAIDVRAAGVNPIDVKVYSGDIGADESQLPMRLGFEAAGVVTSVGQSAAGSAGPLTEGDEVIVFRTTGAYADHLVVRGSSVVPKPPDMSFEQAAGLMLAGTTAVHALTATRVGEGETVLIHGASGGVGLMAVQIAVAHGAQVVATSSEKNHDLLRELGAEPVTYGEGLADRVRGAAPDGVDAALDLVGSDEAVDVSLELVDDVKRIATIAAFGRADTGIQVLGNGPGGDPGTQIRDDARLDLVERVRAGTLHVRVADTFALPDVAVAHEQVAGGHTVGKVVLVP